jgi:hypothetical protein
MAAEFAGSLHVLELSERGVLCARAADADSFWLPRAGHVQWDREPEPGQKTHAVVPGWLAAKHRQLAGDVEYECAREGIRKSRNPDEQIAKGHQMSQEDVGNGALFKNDKKEKPTHPDYRGDVTIHGRKFWASG